MDNAEKERLEEKLNRPGRARSFVRDSQIGRGLELLQKNILEAHPSAVSKLFEAILSKVPESDATQIMEISSLYKDYLRAQSGQDTEKADQKSKSMLIKIQKQIEKEEVLNLYSSVSNEEALKSMLLGRTKAKKRKLMENVISHYQSTDGDYNTFVSMNRILKHFNRRVVREILGVYGEDKIKLSEDEIAMQRCVFGGKFFLPENSAKFSESYRQVVNGMFEKKACLKKDYDLLNKNPLLKSVRDSRNIRKVVSEITNVMLSKGIPPQLAQNFNAYDFAGFMATQLKMNKNVKFADISNDCQDSPQVEFCKKLVGDEKRVQAIREDFLGNGVSKEYLNFWLESMVKNGDANPSLNGRIFSGKIPHKIDIHHKNPKKYAKNLKVDDSSNLMLVVDFDNNEVHNGEHAGDSQTVLVVRDDGSKTLAVSRRTSAKDGDFAMAEKFAYVDESGEDKRCYLSETKNISSEIRGLDDYAPVMSQGRLESSQLVASC